MSTCDRCDSVDMNDCSLLTAAGPLRQARPAGVRLCLTCCGQLVTWLAKPTKPARPPIREPAEIA